MPDRLRGLLVGCGGMSRRWTEVSRSLSDLDLLAFVDLDESAAQARAADYGGTPLVSTDLTEALRQTQPDVVFDCTIPDAHTAVTLEALSSGCHVLGEKPLATSMADARKAVDAAEATGLTYAVIQNRRYDPNIRRLRRTLNNGSIGPLTTVNSDFYIGAHFDGFRNHMPHVLLLDMAIHTFDAARFITGADPVSVFCKEWNPSGSWYDRDASAVAVFEMTGGIVYTYRGSWCSEGLNTTWECDWRMIGQDGSITWDGADRFEGEAITARGEFRSEGAPIEVSPEDTADRIGGHEGLIQDFVECVLTGRTPETVCSDNIKSLAMVFGAIESAEKCRPIDIHW
ncbi:MAG: oxidoreductase [Gemmatimonadetes bacterium]|nr:oxidoreductase [Gemmatimonadota bacterium]